MLFQICKKSICVIALLVLVVSCSDDPAGEAARELRKSASKALTAETNEKVLDNLDKVLKRSSTAGQAANPVRMTAINIALDSAGGQIDKLDDYDSQANEELGRLSLTINNANDLQIEYDNLKEVIGAATKQINILQKQIFDDIRSSCIFTVHFLYIFIVALKLIVESSNCISLAHQFLVF